MYQITRMSGVPTVESDNSSRLSLFSPTAILNLLSVVKFKRNSFKKR